MQEARDELQRMKDLVETKGEELEVCRQQSAEVEMRLGILQVKLLNACGFIMYTRNIRSRHLIYSRQRLLQGQ